MNWPQRIICLTEETVETLYLLDQEDRIAGITGFTVRPARARKEKPKVSAFTSAKIPKILELNPDLVLGFSDLQANIAAELIQEGVEVYVFNHRSVKGILRMISTLGRLVDASNKADLLVERYQVKIDQIREQTAKWRVKPKIYFEEWFDPCISGINWVSELIEIAGGIDCYAENAKHQGAKNRIIAEPLDIAKRNPDIIIGSWCGKRFHPEKVGQRPGWESVNAVKNKDVYEIKSPYILQPGPAAVTEGLDQIFEITNNWYQNYS